MNANKFNQCLRDFINSIHTIFPEDSGIHLTKILLADYNEPNLLHRFKTELTPEVREQLKSHDERLIHDSDFMRNILAFIPIDLTTLWDALTAQNKLVVWSWLNMLACVASEEC